MPERIGAVVERKQVTAARHSSVSSANNKPVIASSGALNHSSIIDASKISQSVDHVNARASKPAFIGPLTKVQLAKSNSIDLAPAAAQSKAIDRASIGNVKQVITFSSLSFSDKQLQKEVSLIESKVSDSMCLSIELNGITLRPALIDQGASRSVMRLSAYKWFVKQHGQGAPKLEEINDMYVVGSTGDHLPIVGRFFARIGTSGVLIGNSFIYVVKDTQEKDIICDLVIGRSTLGSSRYTRLDMSGSGALVSVHPDYVNTQHEVITCSKCTFVNDDKGKRQLVSVSSSESNDQCVSMNSFARKVIGINSIVMQRTSLNHDAKNH